MFAERAVIYCQCVTLSTWVLAWLKDPELWSIVGQTNTSYCRRFISFPGLKSLLGNRRSVRSFALQRSCLPCRQMNFLRTPDQLKLAGIPKLAQCKPHSKQGQLEQGTLGHGQLLSPDTRTGAGGISPARWRTPGKLCLLTAAAADGGSLCLSHFLPVLGARQEPGAG